MPEGKRVPHHHRRPHLDGSVRGLALPRNAGRRHGSLDGEAWVHTTDNTAIAVLVSNTRGPRDFKCKKHRFRQEAAPRLCQIRS